MTTNACDELIASLLTAHMVAVRCGVAKSTITTYLARGRMPEPDYRIAGSPLWRPDTIDGWMAGRPGRGVGGGRPRKEA